VSCKPCLNCARICATVEAVGCSPGSHPGIWAVLDACRTVPARALHACLRETVPFDMQEKHAHDAHVRSTRLRTHPLHPVLLLRPAEPTLQPGRAAVLRPQSHYSAPLTAAPGRAVGAAANQRVHAAGVIAQGIQPPTPNVTSRPTRPAAARCRRAPRPHRSARRSGRRRARRRRSG